ncbi:hypothetical protein FRB99_003819 [Tulasnella sp. 403]|nr:hypothetical protein FRB99_003819 [Tulasnella sp. 403]
MTPQVHRSVIVVEEPELGFVVADKPVPVITDDEILIKVKAVTLNPTDYKHLYVKKDLNAGDSVGCDFAGDVVDVGKNAATNGSFKVGDAAAGFIRGGVIESLNGTFQEYVKILPELAWHVPTDVLSYEDASAMGGIALSTAIQALFHRLKLPTPWEPAKEPIPILIWSGATSVGIYAIRLAKLAGLRVAT